MARYAFITGDSITPFEPIVFVNNAEKTEVICESVDRRNGWYSFLNENRDISFDDFISRFTYQTIDAGEVTPDVESQLNKLRARFSIISLAQEEIDNTQNETSSPLDSAIMRISKRIRTGSNEN